MQKKLKNQLQNIKSKMIYFACWIIIILFLVIIIPAYNNAQKPLIIPRHQVELPMVIDMPAREYVEYKDDSARLVRRFGRIEKKVEERTRIINALELENKIARSEADSLFCEVVNAGN